MKNRYLNNFKHFGQFRTKPVVHTILWIPSISWLLLTTLLCFICGFYWFFSIMHLWSYSCVFAICFCLLSHNICIYLDYPKSLELPKYQLKVHIYIYIYKDQIFGHDWHVCECRSQWMKILSINLWAYYLASWVHILTISERSMGVPLRCELVPPKDL